MDKTTKTEFTNLKANAQRAVMFEKIDAIETHIKEQNGNVKKNSKDLHTMKIIGVVLFVGFCIALKVDLPSIISIW